MRHGKRSQRLSLKRGHRNALLDNLVKSLIVHGQIQTTHCRAKEAQRVADRLVSLGKNGSVHARRLAFRILQDRRQVKLLFGEIAPRFVDCSGGYTRVMRVNTRRGDGASLAILAFSRLPAVKPAVTPKAKVSPAPVAPPTKAKVPEAPAPAPSDTPTKKPKNLFGALRSLWGRKKEDGKS